MQNKREFKWLKLEHDFFNIPNLKKLRKIAGGEKYLVLYLRFMLLTLNSEGHYEFENLEPTIEEELALILDEETVNIKMAISFLLNTNLAQYIDNNILFFAYVPSHLGKYDDSAKRVAELRLRRKQERECNALHSLHVTERNHNETVTSLHVTPLEKEVEKEVEKDLVQVHAQEISNTPDFIHFKKNNFPIIEKFPQEQFFSKIEEPSEYIKKIRMEVYKNWQSIAKSQNARFTIKEWNAIKGYIGGKGKCSLTPYQITTNLESLHKWGMEGKDIINSLNMSHSYKAIIFPKDFYIVYDKNNKRLYGNDLINYRINIIREEEKERLNESDPQY